MQKLLTLIVLLRHSTLAPATARRTISLLAPSKTYNIPGLSMTRVEATYLAWIDTRATGIEDPGAFFEAAGVGLSDGADFGAPGFVRLNFGCRRSLLVEALQRIRKALA